MTSFLQFTLSGVAIGAVYGVLALGWVLVKQVSGLLFFLQGEFVIVTVVVITTLTDDGVPIAAAAAAGIALCVALAYTADVVVIRRLRSATPFSEVLVLLGLALLSGHIIQEVAGPHSRLVEPFLPTAPVEIAGAFVTPHQLLAVAALLVLTALLRMALGRTLVGIAMRASADSADGAVLVGVRPSRVRTVGILSAALLGGLAGVVLGPLAPLSPLGGLPLSLKGFVAAVLARWSFVGAVLAGALLGLAETYAAGYISSVYKDVISLGILVVALLVQAATSERHVTLRPRRRPAAAASRA